MNTLALAVLVTGCATTSGPTAETQAQLVELDRKSEEISERERQCIRGTVACSNDQIARVDRAAPDALAEQQT
jgi:hypothetical protein